MFTPTHFAMHGQAEQHQFIHDFAFGVLVSGSLSGTHLPFILRENEGESGVLYTHCAKENPHWQELDNADVVVIFTGPHNYISPSWYAKGPAVPTWNYTAVHAYGRVSFLNDDETITALDEVVEKYEPGLLVSKDILTDRLKERLLPAIVGFKIEITRMEGQLKLGQQRTKADQLGVYQALAQSSRLEDLALAQYMKKIDIGLGNEYSS
jgi:transcriptional regulator